MKKLLLISCLMTSLVYAEDKCNAKMAEIDTSLGKIEVRLDAKNAPITVKNFETYANNGFYKNKIFHRVIPDFMIQGGGLDKDLVEAKTMSPIKNEANNGLTNDKYTIAMARTQIVDSATSQFFINVKDNNFLNYTPSNPGYAVFGKVVKGFAVVDKISNVKTNVVSASAKHPPMQDVPVNTITIKNIKVLGCVK